MSAVDEIRGQAREVASGWSPPDAPDSWRLTAALFQTIAEHDELLRRLSGLPPDRLPALLASAAARFLIRRDQPDPLARYFPEPGAPQPAFDGGFYPAAAAFFSARLDDIMAICRQRRYQMNEVARCAQVALGITAAIPEHDPFTPVTLVDLGTGAGLGLHLDRYRYVIGEAAAGPPDAPLSLSCAVRGGLAPPRAELPPIAGRTGIELDPVDLEDPAARAWLESCAPPEASALTRLTAAVDVTRRHPAEIVTGDAADMLPGVLASLPPGRRAVVTDAYVAVFLPAERRARLIEVLATAGRTRPVTWLSLDPLVPLGPSGRDDVQGIALPKSLVRDYQRHGVFAVLGALTFDGGTASGRLLARAHPSGQWVEWLDAPSAR